jgi:hypothetical protein
MEKYRPHIFSVNLSPNRDFFRKRTLKEPKKELKEPIKEFKKKNLERTK